MVAAGGARCAGTCTFVAMVVGLSIVMQMVVGMGMGMLMAVFMGMLVGVRNTVVGMLVGMGMTMTVVVVTAGNMIVMNMHKLTPLLFSLLYRFYFFVSIEKGTIMKGIILHCIRYNGGRVKSQKGHSPSLFAPQKSSPLNEGAKIWHI